MTFYLKYRPKDLEELDSKDVRESLKKIVSNKNIPHALLFAGPKGTGKTSAARIIAKIINCESKNAPCDKCEQCISITKGTNLDVIELDAASHRGIDDVRALKDAVKLSPAKANKKVYIIDEAHMLTTEASNALLKTLEEPPSHVVFILATTNPEKLIDTIRSRTTEILFKKALNEEIENSLARIVKGEKIKVSNEVLGLIVKKSNGSFRDAAKLLERYSLEGESYLEKEVITEVEGFIELLFAKDVKKLLDDIEKRVEGGISIQDLIKETLMVLHGKLLEGGDTKELITLIELMLHASRQTTDSPIEELPLEIAVIKWCGDYKVGNGEKVVLNEVPEEKVEGPTSETQKINRDKDNIDEATWKSVLSKVRPINATIEALLRASRPMSFDGSTLKLGVFYKFHKERLEEVGHRRILEDVITELVGNNVRIVCVLTDAPVKPKEEETVLTESEDKDIIKAAEEIFGV